MYRHFPFHIDCPFIQRDLDRTIKQEDVSKIEFHPDFSMIGYMTDLASGHKMVSKSGNVHDLKAQGWTAF